MAEEGGSHFIRFNWSAGRKRRRSFPLFLRLIGLCACAFPVFGLATPVPSQNEFVFADAVAAFSAANEETATPSPSVARFVAIARRVLLSLTRRHLKHEQSSLHPGRDSLGRALSRSSDSARRDGAVASDGVSLYAVGDYPSEELQESNFLEHSARGNLNSDSTSSFRLTGIPSSATGGVSELAFHCQLKEGAGRPIKALLCEGRAEQGHGLISASVDVELTAEGDAAPWSAEPNSLECRLRFHRESGIRVSFVEGLAGLCAAWGYSTQVFTNSRGGMLFEALPELGGPGLHSLGFSVSPARFTEFPAGIELVAVNPNEEAPAERAGEREARDRIDDLKKQASPADFVPLRPLDRLAWRGLPTNVEVYRHYLHKAQEGLASATLTQGRTAAHAHGCSFSLGLKKEYFQELQRLEATLCSPNAELMPCLRQLQQLPWSASRSRLRSLLLDQIHALVPSLRGTADRMLQILMRPSVWWLLQRILGGPAARRRETNAQRRWYDREMQRVSPIAGRKLPFNKLGKTRGVLRSEVLRFATLFVDLLPTRPFWSSFKLPCIQEAFGYLETFSSVMERRDIRRLDFPQREAQPHGLAWFEASTEAADVLPQSLLRRLYAHSPTFLQTEDWLEHYRRQHQEAISRGSQPLEGGKTLSPLSPSYEFQDLKALAEATTEGQSSQGLRRSEEDAAALRRVWLSSPVFSKNTQGQTAFSVKGVPAREGGSLDLQFKCTDSGVFPVSRNLVGWNSRFLCEPLYSYEAPSGADSASPKLPRFRLIGFEFEVEGSHRCGVSYLGNEHEVQVTDVRGQDLLRVFLGFCWLHGFETAWILDSVRDVYTHERMRYTMALENGESFYERAGFLFSIDTIKARSRADSCLAFFDGDEEGGASEGQRQRQAPKDEGQSGQDLFSSGLCRVRRDLLQNPGFEPSVLFPLHKEAFQTLHSLTFDCRQPVWRGCASTGDFPQLSEGGFYPLLRQLPDSGRCAFEANPIWGRLADKFPEKCGFGKRVGDCHAAVRKELQCNSRKKDGCHFMRFLYEGFVYPGGNYRQKLPLQIADAWDKSARQLARTHGLNLKSLLTDALDGELKDCEEGKSQSSRAVSCPPHVLTDGKLLRSLLKEAILVLDLTGLPQFWSTAQLAGPPADKAHPRDAKEDEASSSKALPERRCPAAFAWAFITRLQGQLYRHRKPKQTTVSAEVYEHGLPSDSTTETDSA